ncbi:MAG TPA: hypothetical protein VNW92_15770 [Polyangiaceae bacterium]|jgi:hypothetical protein|nr:hypothetical protein [Polyangiaceae bacterium]
MNKPTSNRSLGALCAFVLGAALGSACGGRSVTVEDGASGGAAGKSSAGAAAGAGATGGRASGGTGPGAGGSPNAGGVSSAGAGNNCGFTACPAIACGSGSSLVFPPGACCPVCQSNCLQQPCPDIACQSGYQLQTQPGQCCPTCVPSTMIDCATGQQKYFQFRAMLLDKYAYGCTTDADCATVVPTNSCESGCSAVAVWSPVVNDLNSNLASDAMTDCAACMSGPVPPCKPPLGNAICSGGQCLLEGPPR